MEGHIITAGYCFPIKTHFSTQLSISVNCDFIQRLLWLIDRCCWRLVLLIQVSGIWSESQQAASQRQTLELIFFVAQLLADFFLQNCTHWGILLKSTAVLQAITKILVKKNFFFKCNLGGLVCWRVTWAWAVCTFCFAVLPSLNKKSIGDCGSPFSHMRALREANVNTHLKKK